MYRITLSAIALCLLTVSPAGADWQYTKWRMTEAQVIAASKGEASTYRYGGNFGCAFNGQTPFAVAPNKTIAGASYDVTFCSGGDDRLSSVTIRPQGEVNIPTLKRALLSQYGQPISDQRGMTIWRDTKTRNTVTLSTISDITATIEYKALGGGGL